MKNINKLRELYKQKGYALIRYDDMPLHSYPYDSPWLTDPEFTKLYNKARKNTLVDRVRCYALYLLAQEARSIDGDVLEVGVWRGGTASIFTQVLPKKTVYLADTFAGVVKSSDWEHYSDKAHADTSHKLVSEYLNNEIQVSNYKILKGVFPDKTGKELIADKLALVYLDVDVYLSTKESFEYVWGRVSRGGIVIFDDYGMISACGGIKRYIDEIKDDEDKLFIQNLNGQAYIIKK